MAEARRAIAAAEWLDSLPAEAAREALARCCGSRQWVAGMLSARPFGSLRGLLAAARTVWAGLARDDYLEAFSCHPPIGGNLAALAAKFAPTLAWSAGEQSEVGRASEVTLRELDAGNRAYQERFGFIFIICASGKSAEEMRDALYARLANDPAVELLQAAGEQAKITERRLEKLGA
jgi:2-oxo-4-hydroxy-4-carboxy-5-ureidoimidazoline decarboxylase